MKNTPLSESGDPKLFVRAYNLGLKLVPNLIHVMTLGELEYWERHLNDLKGLLANGVKIPPGPPAGRRFMTIRYADFGPYRSIILAIVNDRKWIGENVELMLRAGILKMRKAGSGPEPDLDLCEVSGQDLGFTGSVTEKELMERAFVLGFEKCPVWAGPLVRLLCNDSKGRTVAMDPIEVGSDTRVFYLGSSRSGPSLTACLSDPECVWSEKDVWVFVWPRLKNNPPEKIAEGVAS